MDRSSRIIQAGMGIGVSNWVLANAVAKAGQIGVVSGTALDTVFVRRLQDGDPGGHSRQALSAFPDQDFAEKTLSRFFRPTGRPAGKAYTGITMLTAEASEDRQKLIVLANFVEVFLAKRGHSGKVGINFLEKIQLPILPSLYGALLAGVDYVLMGAGIPREIPAVLDKLALHQDVEYKLTVTGADVSDQFKLKFSPQAMLKDLPRPPITRPKFFAIISSSVLAQTLVKKVSPPVDGFIVEMPTAGGHNAPPRGQLNLSARGEPVYGPKDAVDLKVIAGLGLPFWLAGSMGSAEGLSAALSSGAEGIQVGTAFALCDESGVDRALKNQVIERTLENRLDVFTDPVASPTGFPFKVARLEGTNSEAEIYEGRTRRCNLGYLRELYKKDDGTIGYRCPAEPVDQFVKKGGMKESTQGRKCLCNGLMSTIGLGQITSSGEELPLVTIGDDVKNIGQFLRDRKRSFSAQDVISVLSGELHAHDQQEIQL